MLKLFIFISLLLPVSYAEQLTFDEFKQKWSSPLTDPTSQKVLLAGSALTTALILNKKGIIDPVQKAASEDRPLGIFSNFGDAMGKAVPNTIYLVGMAIDYHENGSLRSLKRANYMLETTVYTGITTVLLKNLIRQQRPNKGDKLSFPSGHTSTASAFAAVVALEHEWYWGVLAGATAALVGYSRINDNAHYLHDVVFGATLGISYGLALKKYHFESDQKINFIPMYFGEDSYQLMAQIQF